jgi:L,D-peptidoglycan transpeptidase YkuD (ErfK/YbiS/YcfS/YnhG family)
VRHRMQAGCAAGGLVVVVALVCLSVVAASAAPRPPMGLSHVDGARQVIVVTAPSTRSTVGTLRAFALTSAGWRQAFGPIRVRTGRRGWVPAARRREGDGTTPEGIFAIGPTVYGVRPDPGVTLRSRRLVPGDYWDENPTTGAAYNTFRHSANTNCAHNPFGGATECLWREAPDYNYFAVIGFNIPATGAYGSGIFMHVLTGGATAGCVAVTERVLIRILRWLRPGAAPRIVLAGPAARARF